VSDNAANDIVTPLVLEAVAHWNETEVVAALGTGFTVLTAGTQRSRLTWLDSFDWRLYRAGLVLEHRQARGAGLGQYELRLSHRAGELLAVQTAATRPPATPDELESGPLRAELTRIVQMRALLCVAAMDVTARQLRLLDTRDKTVVRIVLEQAVVSGRSLPLRIVVEQVRGYPAQARRAGALLVASGASAIDGSRFQAALAAVGRCAGDYSNRICVQLDPQAPSPQSVARLLLAALDGIEANVDGTLRDLDTEFLHDLRVNVRRTRAALKLTGDVLPGELATRFEPEFRWLGAVTSALRDLDVHLLELDEVSDAVAGLEPLRRHLGERRRVERRRLLAALRSARFTTLGPEWRAALTELAIHADPSAPATALLAAQRIGQAHRRLLRRGAAIGPDSAAEQLHALRKRGKELRYLLEFFASLHDPGPHRKVVEELKALQDVLGRFQDGELQRSALIEFAEQMSEAGTASAATLLAMGELAARLDTRQAARDEFGARFAQFTSVKNTRRMHALTRRYPAGPKVVSS
jgi:CHAD domain-containing protein